MRNKVALVTGGSRGIGRAICIRLAKQGYWVAVGYQSNSAAADEVVGIINSSGGRAIAVCADVSDESAVKSMLNIVHSEFGKVDCLVNNAGIALQGLFQDGTDTDARRVFDVNVFGCFNTARALIPELRGGGAIVNVSSIWGQVGGSCETVYSAAKAAIIGFTKALAKELAPCGVRVNCIAPGVIRSDMTESLGEDTLNALADEIPLGRIGTPEDVAGAVVYLLSEDAAYVTGQVLAINGGMN